MGSLVKIIIGVLLIVVGMWWIAAGSSYLEPVKAAGWVTSRPALADFITVLNGSIPPFLALIGFLVVWLEWDNIKIQKEMAKEKKGK
ncbi:MAG: hypothetical protein HYT70_04235 [Candidatus Aenigmarchaeota archaeon]|nr:hypothetical protein [Candidatus Aenigmarchaeota archaeon]